MPCFQDVPVVATTRLIKHGTKNVATGQNTTDCQRSGGAKALSALPPERPSTTRTNHSHQPLAPTTRTNHSHQPLAPTTSKNRSQSPLVTTAPLPPLLAVIQLCNHRLLQEGNQPRRRRRTHCLQRTLDRRKAALCAPVKVPLLLADQLPVQILDRLGNSAADGAAVSRRTERHFV